MNSKTKQNLFVLLAFVALVAAAANNAALAQWVAEVVDGEGNVGFYSDLAYDPAGNPAIAYSDSGNDLVKFAHWNGASWDIETVGAAGGDFGISLAYDGGQPTVTYIGGGLYFAYRSGSGVWDRELVDERALSYDTSLAYDGSGNPSISYVGTEKHPNRLYLKFARWNGTSWDIEIVDGGADYNSLAYDLGGNPAIAYSHSDGLKLARRDGASWDIETVETGENVGIFACLAFDPTTGYPSILHFSRFACWNGSSWEFEEIGDGAGLSLAYDSYGTAFVSRRTVYDDSDVLEVAQRSAGSEEWETEIVDWVLSPLSASIAIDPAGNPAVSYQDFVPFAGDLKFAWRDPFFNVPPAVTITSPKDGGTFPSGDTVPIVFTGIADDREDGDLTALLTWTSDVDGLIGSGGSFSATLSVGYHIITASVTDSGGKTGSDSVSITVGEPTTPAIYVEDIEMDWGNAGVNYYGLATVWIIDYTKADVDGATVYGQWSGDVSGTASGVTGADGKVTLQSPKKKHGRNFTFTVTDVEASGYIYDEGLNAETEDSITVP